jgi:hypothetical protein
MGLLRRLLFGNGLLPRGIEVTTEGPEKVCLGYDPHAFNPDTSGRVEVRLKTPKAAEIVALLKR